MFPFRRSADCPLNRPFHAHPTGHRWWYLEHPFRLMPPRSQRRAVTTSPAYYGPSAKISIRRTSKKDRKSVVQGKSVSVRVDLGGRRIIKKKNRHRLKQQSVS